MLDSLINDGILMEAATVAITGLVAWGVGVVKSRFGVEIEARHREALQQALVSGARLAITKSLTGPAAVAVAVDYARSSVPDAVKALKPRAEQLDALAETKIQELTGFNVDLPIDKIVTEDKLQAALDKILSQHRS